MKKMKIAISGGKGGTGKTSVATAIAIEYAKSKKTILVDADVECPNDHLPLSINREKLSTVYQPIPKWDLKKCIKCGKCAQACNKDAIVFVKDKYPAFIKENCVGCKACIYSCPLNAISETKKEIGTIYMGTNYDVDLVSGELKLGELASGEMVAAVRDKSDKISCKNNHDIMIIDSAAGIGCPVIASIVGTDYLVAVTEPTPPAFHDLKRILYLAEHFRIPCGLVINKHDISIKFCKKLEEFASQNNIPILGKLPYSNDFVESLVKMKPIGKINKKYENIFKDILSKINER